MKKLVAVLLLLIAGLSFTGPVLADGIIIIDPPPEPVPHWEPWLTIRYHRVTVTIEDQVATTKVDQVFCNDGPVAAEGTYVFPLPPGAVVQRFVMWVDGKPVEGEVLPADKAREIYEGYVRRQRDPALLEYVGRDAVQARIFPIPPGEERRIQLEYTQILPAEGGLMYYRYPLDTERFSAMPLEQVSISVEIASKADLRAIYSPSHQDEVVITRQGTKRAGVSFEASHVLPDRDFELYVSTSVDDIGANLLSYQTGSEDGFFLLILSPALEVEAGRVLPRDIFLVLDTSGSMDGEKLEQAQAALVYILKHLNPEDRFNVIAFSSDVRSYAHTPRPGSEAAKAIDWVNGLDALGGTNIYQALSETMSQADTERPAVVIFLTDGLPTEGIVEEQTLLAMLAQEAPASVRIFPFGVGYDVNTLFLDQLAQDHRGSPAYVEPHERIDEKVSAFYAKVQSPLLTNIALDFGDVQTYDVYPSPLPDLYAGTQLIVAGRYVGSGPQRIELAGEVEGRRKTYTYEGNFVKAGGADFIPRLWAARKIGYLLTQIRIHGEDAEWIDAVVTLSLRYGIITPYTSFLIEEQDRMLTSDGREQAAGEFEKSLELAPLAPSGEGAVQDAEMRQDLGGAEAPPTAGGMVPPAEEGPGAPVETGRYVRYVGDKTFFCDATTCTDTAYIPDKMQVQDVVFLSEAYWRLLEAHPDWASYFAVADETIFVAPDGSAYRFRFGASAEEVSPPASAGEPEQEPSPEPTDQPNTDLPPEATPASGGGRGVCGGAVALMVVGLVAGIQGRRRSPHQRQAKM